MIHELTISARFEFSEPSTGSRTLSMLSPSHYFIIDFEQRAIIKKLNVDFSTDTPVNKSVFVPCKSRNTEQPASTDRNVTIGND
jgi:hypothetical protein